MTVSILVPVYNAEKYLYRCVDSILSQTFSDFEVILANDGSTDNSLKICDEYAEKDNRIKVISHKNIGVAGTREGLLRLAEGDFILFVDSDDWLESCMIERMMDLTESCDMVFCGNDTASSPEQKVSVAVSESEIWNQEKTILEFIKHKHMSGMLWNKLIRRSVTDGVSFNEKTGYGEDAEFLWQVLKNVRKMAVTDEVLYHHVLEENSISHLSYSEKKYSAIPMWEKINDDVEKNYPRFIKYARVSLMCAAVYGSFEARQSGYKNKEHIEHMRAIARRNFFVFLFAKHISVKFKVYALAVCLGV